MNVDRISLSMGGAGKSSKKFPTRCAQHKDVVEWIKKKGYNDRVTQELIKIAKGFPTGMLHIFKKNFSTHLKNVREKYDN